METMTVRHLALALLLIAFVASLARATEDFAAKEELECSVCHDDPEGTLLTDQGSYYQYMETLEGYDQVITRFGGCTYCHVPDIDSDNLTREGYRFRWMMEDMQGLRAWLEENHPKPSVEDDSEKDD